MRVGEDVVRSDDYSTAVLVLGALPDTNCTFLEDICMSCVVRSLHVQASKGQ